MFLTIDTCITSLQTDEYYRLLYAYISFHANITILNTTQTEQSCSYRLQIKCLIKLQFRKLIKLFVTMAVTQNLGVFALILADPNTAVTFNGKSVVIRTYVKPNPMGLKCDSLQLINKDLFTSTN